MNKQKGIVDDISEYVKKNLKKGYKKDSLKWALINQGHSKFEIEKAMQKAQAEIDAESRSTESKPKIEYKITPIIEKKSFWKRFFG